MAAAPAVARNWTGPAPLGVGLSYTLGHDLGLLTRDHLDFVEITPDILCRVAGGELRLAPGLLDVAQRACGDLPIAVHGVELSIGSAHGWNAAYLTMLADFQARWPFAWHSEHLHFQTVMDSDGPRDTGVPLPLPLTHEAAALVANRSAELIERFGVPFLLENAAQYLGRLPGDADIAGEEEFIAEIAAASGCGLLLDLHNLHCNAVNHGFDATTALDRLPLDRVGEIHVAGGSWAEGFYLDAHDGLVPDPVWALLELALPRCRNVAGLVFEMLDVHVRRTPPEAIAGELAKLRAAWARYVGPRALAA